MASNPLRQQKEAVRRGYHSYMKDVNKRRTENQRFYGGADYDAGRVKRRVAGTATTIEEFKSRFYAVFPNTPEGFDFETDWTESNATPRLACVHLTNYLQDSGLEASNNRAERCIKPFVIAGRTSCLTTHRRGPPAVQ